ncbi:helix-turn-helix domain-containing protein [Actinoplanes sp. N902-109]|uniref:helix-turn-helix domain-containing protein n=1 Tax=Actinoplanes sp. (strain N902-109) TaxID=649831 RepID=UPI0018DCB3BF
MARRASVSARHLARLFRQELGMTPTQFVLASRVEAAQRLLVSGVPVMNVAQQSGFGSEETFRRAFQRHVGSSPSAYRARVSDVPKSASDSRSLHVMTV